MATITLSCNNSHYKYYAKIVLSSGKIFNLRISARLFRALIEKYDLYIERSFDAINPVRTWKYIYCPFCVEL